MVGCMKRVKLRLADLEVEFTDRDGGIQQVERWSERGTWSPVVVFGPEGCGKTAWLKQSVEALKELGFSVIYFNPMRKEFLAEVGVKSVEEKALEALRQASTVHALAGLIGYVIDFAVEAIKLGRGRLAVIVDDAFQLTGAQEAALFVKGMLELIEHPPHSYERVVAIAATSEGASRWEIGRHRWAELRAMWNMAREGFEDLYEQVRRRTSGAPSFESIWPLTGGNPSSLAQLYRAGWDATALVTALIEERKLTPSFIDRWKSWLEEAVRDPDALWRADVPEELIDELVARNLIVYNMHSRTELRWIDQPPPEKDLELGVGRHVAWQTPLHREAVRRALEERK
jgi:hypothetical protein